MTCFTQMNLFAEPTCWFHACHRDHLLAGTTCGERARPWCERDHASDGRRFCGIAPYLMLRRVLINRISLILLLDVRPLQTVAENQTPSKIRVALGAV